MTKNRPFWLSHHILECIHDRNTVYAKAKNSNNYDDLVGARQACNNTNKLINGVKEEFIKDSLDRDMTAFSIHFFIVYHIKITIHLPYCNPKLGTIRR